MLFFCTYTSCFIKTLRFKVFELSLFSNTQVYFVLMAFLKLKHWTSPTSTYRTDVYQLVAYLLIKVF